MFKFLTKMRRYIACVLVLTLCSIYILNTNQGVKTLTAETTKLDTLRMFENTTDVTIVPQKLSLEISNSTLAIYVNGRLGNALFEIASGVGIAEHYKVINFKLEPTKIL